MGELDSRTLFQDRRELNHFQSYLIVFALYSAYLIMAIPSSAILKRVGFKRGIMYGFFCTALGALIFIPAAWWRSYPVFLAGSFVIGRRVRRCCRRPPILM